MAQGTLPNGQRPRFAFGIAMDAPEHVTYV